VLQLVGMLGLVAVVALAASAIMLYQRAGGEVTQVPIDELTDPDEAGDAPQAVETDARAFLVVGSDERPDADDAPDEVATGDVDGQRSDAIMYVSLSDDRDSVSIISLPRDLLVDREDGPRRLGETFEGGPGALVSVVQEEYGLPVHHYAKVTFGGFIDAVRTLGGVEMCLEDDLVDPDAGADLEAGCQRLDPEDALAFVRSRQGDLADLERIERQQRFVRATLEELTERNLLADVPRLFDLVRDVAGSVTTDDRLSVAQMLGLADEVRDLVRDDIPMTSVPAYPDTVGQREVLRPYEPGARALFDDVRRGRAIADRGSREERAGTAVAIWTGEEERGTEIVASTLLFAGFEDRRAGGPVPPELSPGSRTTVYAASGQRAAAERVAALLGAPLRELPGEHEMPQGADVAVAVGRDAVGTGSLEAELPHGETSIETKADPG
jgi:LCP family protein required for cell wall assembly